MQDQKTTTLTTVLSDVLANLAFMFTDDEALDPPVGEQWLQTGIGYNGSASGTLHLICTRTFAAQLAANLLGVESGSETTGQESMDAVKEFMNIVCGQYVTAAYGTEDIFNLTIPEIVERTTPEFDDVDELSGDVVRLSVDGQWMELHHTHRA